MTPESFYESMQTIYAKPYDEEVAHQRADELLCQALTALGYKNGVEIFKAATKWYA